MVPSQEIIVGDDIHARHSYTIYRYLVHSTTPSSRVVKLSAENFLDLRSRVSSGNTR